MGELLTMKKEELRRETDTLIQELPDDTSWDDLMYRIYVRQKIERGHGDKESGQVHSTRFVEEHFSKK